MAQQLYFSRDTKFYVAIGANIWEIPILDGFSFAQANNSSEIVLSEMESTAGVSRRGKRVFNDALAPVEWSVTTYIRPFLSAGGDSLPPAGAVDTANFQHGVEEVLWALLGGPATYAASTFTSQFVGDATDLDINFSQSNKSVLGTASFYFVTGDANKVTYKIAEAVVNEANIDFDIDGIASIQWSGFGSLMTRDAEPTATLFEAITETGNFIRNRLTTLSITPNTTDLYGDSIDELEASYSVTLTGGSITFTNNMQYVTPEELGIVNQPLGHITGARSVSGSFTCYVVDDTTNTTESVDFWEDMALATEQVTHSFALTFAIGGAAGATRMEFTMAQAHIEIPEHQTDDVIGLETTFHGLPLTIDATDEALVKYVGVAY